MIVEAVHRSAAHGLGKERHEAIRLVAGRGVEGDAHFGEKIQHRSRVARDPTQPNLRQIHLIGGELIDELRTRGFVVGPGELGENVTTRGVDLLSLPFGALLRLGETAAVQITGLRNPCVQLEARQRGLAAAVLRRRADGTIARRAGVLGIVVADGLVREGDPVEVELPPGAQRALEPV